MNSFIFLKLSSFFLGEEIAKDGFHKFNEESVLAFNKISEKTRARMVLLDDTVNIKSSSGYNPFISLLLYRKFRDTTAIFGKVMSDKAIQSIYDRSMESPVTPMGYLINHWELNHLVKPYNANPKFGRNYEVWTKNKDKHEFVGMKVNVRSVDFKIAIFGSSTDDFYPHLYTEHADFYVSGDTVNLDMAAADKIIEILTR